MAYGDRRHAIMHWHSHAKNLPNTVRYARRKNGRKMPVSQLLGKIPLLLPVWTLLMG